MVGPPEKSRDTVRRPPSIANRASPEPRVARGESGASDPARSGPELVNDIAPILKRELDRGAESCRLVERQYKLGRPRGLFAVSGVGRPLALDPSEELTELWLAGTGAGDAGMRKARRTEVARRDFDATPSHPRP